MTTSTKNIIGVLTFLPIVFGLLAWIVIFNQIGNGNPGNELSPERIAMAIKSKLIIVIIYYVGLLIFYLIDVVRNPKLQGKTGEKLLWIVLFLFVGWIAMVIYYFAILRSRNQQVASDNTLDNVD